MVAGVFVLCSASLQEALENNFIILKWFDAFSRGICVVVLPVQVRAWVSDLVLSFPDQCWADLPSQVVPQCTYYCSTLRKGHADA